MLDTNGTATVGEATANRLPADKPKPANRSKFQEVFNFLKNAEGGKPKLSLTRKTEEGKMTASIAGFPKSLTINDVQNLAEEVGLKAQVKSDSGVGAAEASASRSLTEEVASKFVKLICDE